METTWGLEARTSIGEWEHIGMFDTRGMALVGARQAYPSVAHNEDGDAVFGLTRDTVNGRQMTEQVTIQPAADGGLRLIEIYP